MVLLKSGTQNKRSDVCRIVAVRSGENWWADSMECYCNLRNIQDRLSDGKTPYERRFEEPFKGPVIPFGSLVEYHLSLRKTSQESIRSSTYFSPFAHDFGSLPTALRSYLSCITDSNKCLPVVGQGCFKGLCSFCSLLFFITQAFFNFLLSFKFQLSGRKTSSPTTVVSPTLLSFAAIVTGREMCDKRQRKSQVTWSSDIGWWRPRIQAGRSLG